MSEPSDTGWPPPIIDSFALHKPPPAAAPPPGDFPPPIARVIVRGRNFFQRAIPPKIAIGDFEVVDFEILSDESTLVLYLFRRPPDGGRITVSYGPGLEAVSDRPFAWDDPA